MKKSHKIILLILVIALVVGGYFLLNTKGKKPSANSEPIEEINTKEQGNIITSVYTNEEYGFQFIYPEGWYIGDNNLGRGTLQLFNYQESEASVSFFSQGMNKIEAVVVADNPYESSSDYPDAIREITEVNVVGQKSSRVEIELTNLEKMIGYLIPLENHDGKYIAITIYGDPSNFYVLEEIVASLTLLK